MDTKDLADAVRAACVAAASDAYEDAGIQGLCAEGRWEAALSALRRLDLDPLLEAWARRRSPDAPADPEA